MADVSNKTLVIVLTVSVAVFLVGVLVSVSNMGGLDELTGLAVTNSTGQAQLTVTSTTELTNQLTSINWGSGYVNSSHTNCTLDSEATVGLGCVSFSSQSSGFLLENTGNNNISVNYTSDGDASTFLGGTGPQFNIKATPNSAASQSGESSTTDSVTSCNNAWGASTYTSITTTGIFLCGSGSTYPLSFEADRDAVVVDVQVLIPEDAPIAAKSATITFNGASS